MFFIEVEGDPDRIVEKNRITFLNMSKEDAQVIQCNVTNKHGYIFANAYLNVLSKWFLRMSVFVG